MTAPQLVLQPVLSAAGRVKLPGSKSISNRALLLAALADGTSELRGVLEADDTERMIEALEALGVSLKKRGDCVLVTGCGGDFPEGSARLFLGNAGTAARPLTAALALRGGDYVLDGVERMRERPIGDLVTALRELGADIECLSREGFLPLRIGKRRRGPSSCSVAGSVSSQFLSSLLMAAPVYSDEAGMDIRVRGDLISRPYVAMTTRLMGRFGAKTFCSDGVFHVPHAPYTAASPFTIEGDASGASYFLALGALKGTGVMVEGVGRNSIQGDTAFAYLLEEMGARIEWGDDWIKAAPPLSGKLKGIDADCVEIPDAAMTLAVLGLFTDGPVTLTGIGSWRVKETDRIEAMRRELSKLGASVESGDDWMRISPPASVISACLETYNDHRMAMSLSLASCGASPVVILDPGCVSKTFPGYFGEFARLTGAENN